MSKRMREERQPVFVGIFTSADHYQRPVTTKRCKDPQPIIGMFQRCGGGRRVLRKRIGGD